MTTPTLREALERCDHTLTAHGHIDANTPLHDTIRAALASHVEQEPVAVSGVINAGRLIGMADRETLARSLFLLNEQHNSGAPIRFNCGWDALKSWNKSTFYAAADTLIANRDASPRALDVEALNDLILFWKGRSQALRALYAAASPAARYDATLRQAETYETATSELAAAISNMGK